MFSALQIDYRSVQVPSYPVQRMVFDEIHGYSLTSINPFLDDSSPKDHAFVHEFSCIAKIPIILYLSKKNLLKNFQENIEEMRLDEVKAQRALEYPCIVDLQTGSCGFHFLEAFLRFLKRALLKKK
ncbi:hypothetical protein HN51_015921 [Arachis hypogaea]